MLTLGGSPALAAGPDIGLGLSLSPWSQFTVDGKQIPLSLGPTGLFYARQSLNHKSNRQWIVELSAQFSTIEVDPID